MKIISVVGARPQFIKATMISRLFRLKPEIREILIHTGQHYDNEMSDVFFNELEIPEPNYHLGVGSASHAKQTGEMLVKIEGVLLKEKPDIVLVYGDTNTTLAGALAAAKLSINLAHAEAGLRSYNKRMPEEINRVVTDHVCDLLFAPTGAAVNNLAAEGIIAGVYNTGDVMYDAALYYLKNGETKSQILSTLSLEPKTYLLATVHRAENTDNLKNLSAIIETLAEIDETIVFPIHPRTRLAIQHTQPSALSLKHVKMIAPVSYLDMLLLEKNARLILTDSGGVQKEAYFFQTPCITLRKETEWVETVEDGWNVVVGADKLHILKMIKEFVPQGRPRKVFGDGHAAQKIIDILCGFSG